MHLSEARGVWWGMTSFAERIRVVVQQLREMPAVALIDAELGAPLAQAELDAVEQQRGAR